MQGLNNKCRTPRLFISIIYTIFHYEKSGSVSSKRTRLKLELLRQCSFKSNFVYQLIKMIWPILTVEKEVVFFWWITWYDEQKHNLSAFSLQHFISWERTKSRVYNKTFDENQQNSTNRLELKSGKLWQAQNLRKFESLHFGREWFSQFLKSFLCKKSFAEFTRHVRIVYNSCFRPRQLDIKSVVFIRMGTVPILCKNYCNLTRNWFIYK